MPTTFECEICYAEQPLKNVCPQSTMACDCSGLMCNTCWVTDFANRKKAFLITSDGEETVVTCWGDANTLIDHLSLLFAENPIGITVDSSPEDIDAKFTEFVNERYWMGRSCPFCKVTCLWKHMNVPSYNLQTMRVTVNSPEMVVNGRDVF